MFSIVHKMQRSPADAWVNAHRHAERKKEYLTWHHGLPTGWLRDFVIKGLRPFLWTHGFDIALTDKECMQWVAEWAFTHVRIARHPQIKHPRTFIKSFNDGDEQEFDWFCYTISTETWMKFADTWKTDEFLDESDAGYAQRYDLLMLAWNIINMSSSKAYDDWLVITKESGAYGQDDELTTLALTSEDTAFGGDRRTH